MSRTNKLKWIYPLDDFLPIALIVTLALFLLHYILASVGWVT